MLKNNLWENGKNYKVWVSSRVGQKSSVVEIFLIYAKSMELGQKRIKKLFEE